MLTHKIMQLVKVPSRSYERPAGRKKHWLRSWWDRNYNPMNPDGSVAGYRALKFFLAFTAVNLYSYQTLKQISLYNAGKETLADYYWTNHEVDLGFRSTTKDKTDEAKAEPESS